MIPLNNSYNSLELGQEFLKDDKVWIENNELKKLEFACLMLVDSRLSLSHFQNEKIRPVANVPYKHQVEIDKSDTIRTSPLLFFLI